MHPKISVVMPVYNGEKYLKESIESILNQSFNDFELLIINDKSIDRTEEIIKECAGKDDRIRLIQNQNQKGLPGALNTGLAAARGYYIARADADDINRPYRLKMEYEFLETHPQICIVGGGYAPFNENGHRMNIFHPASSIEIAWRFISNTYFCHPSVMFRREIIEDIGGYPDVGAEDFAFFSKIIRQYRCANLKKILIQYREHQTNYSITAKDRVRESVKNTFKENYLYYMGNLEYSEIFYQYQAENKLNIKNLFIINAINFHILNKIRNQYNFSLLHIEFLRMIVFLQIKNIRAAINIR